MEPLPSGLDAKKTNAQRFDEAQASRRNAAFLEVARYFGDVEARLRKEDYHRFQSALLGMQKASGCEGMTAAKEAVVLIISGEPDLVARFDDFLEKAAMINTEKGSRRGAGWEPRSVSGSVSGSGSGSGSGSS